MPKITPKLSNQTVNRDEYWLDVVGESHYYNNFKKICGYRDRGVDVETVAALIAEDGNPHDPGNAVRVEIEGYTVGYLRRQDAAAVRKMFKKLKTDAITDIPARIRGGWSDDDADADFGVKLNLDSGSETMNSNYPLPIIVRSQPGCLLQLVYFVFIGWWLGGLAISLAYLLLVTVIGIPLGVAIINRIPYLIALRETDPIVSYVGVTVERHNFLIRAIWFLLVGFWLTALWLAVAYACACTIILMPVGFWMFDRAPGVLTLYRRS